MTAKNDEVLDAAEQRLADARRRLDNLTQRREREARGVATHDGRVRPAIAARVAERDKQVDALHARVTEAEATLQAARDDLPRREQERKRAGTLEREHADLLKAAEQKRAELARAEQAATDKQAEAEAARRAASTLPAAEAEVA